MNGEHQTILSRVDKLLRLAKSEPGTPEGELAASLARKLMLEHAISEQEVLSGAKSGKIGPVDHDLGKRQNWRRRLFNHVAEHCECRAAYIINSQRATIYGFAEDIEVALYLYESIANQIDLAVNEHMKRWNARAPYGRTCSGIPRYSRRERNNFCHSAVSRIYSRLKDIRRGVAEGDPDRQALVSLRGRTVDEWVQVNEGNLSRGRLSWSGNKSGYAAGDQVSITQGIHGSRGQLPG